jgi:hypothetical protein
MGRARWVVRARRQAVRGDDGQVGVAMAMVVLAAVTGMILLLGALGATVNDRLRARTAADAAALAGVTGGRAAAEEVARANAGVVESYAVLGPSGRGSGDVGVEVEVAVRVGRARAVSRAAPLAAATGSGDPPP